MHCSRTSTVAAQSDRQWWLCYHSHHNYIFIKKQSNQAASRTQNCLKRWPICIILNFNSRQQRCEQTALLLQSPCDRTESISPSQHEGILGGVETVKGFICCRPVNHDQHYQRSWNDRVMVELRWMHLLNLPTALDLRYLSSAPLLCKARWGRSHTLEYCWSFPPPRPLVPNPDTAWLFSRHRTPPWITPMVAWWHTVLGKAKARTWIRVLTWNANIWTKFCRPLSSLFLCAS